MSDRTIEIELPSVDLPAWDDDLAALMRGDADAPLDDVRGEVLAATIEDIEDDALRLRADGRAIYVPLAEAALPGQGAPSIGDAVHVLVTGTRTDGELVGAVDRGTLVARADTLRALVGGPSVEGTIRYVTRRGFAVDVDGLRAFLPGRRSGIPRHAAFDAIGREMRLDVLEWDEPNAQLVVARSQDEERAQEASERAAWATIEEGSDHDGTVVDIRPFGAIVDIGNGVRGLCHVSELDTVAVDHPSEAVTVGEAVRVRVLEVQPDRRRIALSRRALLLDALEERFAAWTEGRVTTGIVRRLADFGAFIELERGIEGLCHVSEITWSGRPAHPSDALQVGDEVTVRVLGVDRERRRIGLSIRQASESPWTTFAASHPEGSIVETTVDRIEDYGLFLRVADGITGLCHVSDLAWGQRPTRPSDVGTWAVGDTVTARILSIDISGQRLSLGIRQLEGDPWDDAVAAGRLALGAVIEAPVTRIEDHAAWFEIVPGLEARMHISEMSTERIDSVRAFCRPGQSFAIMLVQVDRDRRRVDASIRAIELKERGELPTSWKEDGTFNLLGDALRDRGLVD